MKRFLTICFVLIGTLAFAQLDVSEKKEPIKIGEIKPMGQFLMSCLFHEELDEYYFMFRDLTYQQLFELEGFYIDSDNFEELYSLIIENLQAKSKKDLEIQLSNGDELTLNFIGKNMRFRLWNGYSWSFSQYFNIKKINQLFGKEEG